jgi:hypothetical protein
MKNILKICKKAKKHCPLLTSSLRYGDGEASKQNREWLKKHREAGSSLHTT